jgi:hypothetical protein
MHTLVRVVFTALMALFLFVGCSSPSKSSGPAAQDSASEERGAAAPYFVNVAEEAGLTHRPAQRVAFVDLNRDGFIDCVLGRIWQEKANYVLLNREGNVFEDFTEASRLTRPCSGEGRRAAHVLIFGDVDNDGDMDAFSGIYCDFENPDWEGDRNRSSAVYLNNGTGIFAMVGASEKDFHPATTCAAVFFDGDLDGCIDLFVGNGYRRYGASLEAYPDRLYRGKGNGHFEDITERAGLLTLAEPGRRDSSKPVYGAGSCDYNNDGHPDILVCVYGRQWNFLWENQGDGTYVDAAERTGFDGDAVRHGRYPEWLQAYNREKNRPPRQDEKPFRSNGNTFSVAPADYDGDGDMDLFLGEITHGWAGEASDRSSLLINQGEGGRFMFHRDPDAARRIHPHPERWNQGDIHVAWLDFDNDGLEDLLISSGDYPDGQYLRLFRQDDRHAFTDITEACGFDWESSAGISVGDFDRDGDLDILAGKSWMRMPAERRKGDHPACALFRNEVGNRNHWLAVRLVGRGAGGSNRMGVGARITVDAGGRRQIREIYGGCGHSGQFNPPEAHFGLGKVTKVDRITVRWPDKAHTVQTLEQVEADRLITIVQEEWRARMRDI